MAMARSTSEAAKALFRMAAASRAHIAASSPYLRRSRNLDIPALLHPVIRPFSTSSAAQSWRVSISPGIASPCGISLIPRNSTPEVQMFSPSFDVRAFSKRPKKWQGGPHAYVQVEPGAPCPPYSPNAGSVKNRKHNKRMAQRDAFIKAQAQQRKRETTAALIKRDADRRKRWREGAARARAWAKHLQKQQITVISA